MRPLVALALLLAGCSTVVSAAEEKLIAALRILSFEAPIKTSAEFQSAIAADFQWADLRRLSQVLILPASHPLAQLKKIPPRRLSGVSLIGLGRENFPGYAESMRALLKPFGVRPQFIKMLNDGVAAMFAELEASHAAAILADGIINTMPRTLVARPFSPSFPPVLIQVGIPATATNPHAQTFAQLLREEAAGAKRR